MDENYVIGYPGERIDELLGEIASLAPATEQAAGTMSASDKTKLNGIESGAQGNVIETVKVGGTALTPDAEKAVNVPVDQAPTSNSPNPISSGAVFTAIGQIEEIIPTQASAQNQLADKGFVNSSIATSTATFRGTFNLVTDLGLSVSATHAQVATALNGAVATKDSNDYAFVMVPTADATPTEIGRIERYKYDGSAWGFEYELNNSGFTAVQWASINSGITSALVEKLGDLPSAAALALALAAKADKDNDAVAGNIAKFDGEGNPVDSGVSLSFVRNPARVSEGLADTISAGAPQEFTFRKSGGDGVNYMRRILGRTLVWNQKVQNGNFADGTTGWTGITSVVDGVANATKAATGTGTLTSIVKLNMPYINGHTYLFVCLAKSNNATTYFNLVPTGASADGGSGRAILPTWTLVSYLWTRRGTATALTLRGDNTGNPDADIDFSVKNVMCFDLTQMWGTGDEPTAEASRALYNKAYFPATPAALISNDAAALKTVGFNQWDEVWEVGSISSTTGENSVSSTFSRSKNFIPIVSGKTYFVKGKMYPRYYDADKNYIGYTASITNNEFTPIAGAAFMRFVFEGTTYANDICINLSDQAKNGTYEPYWKRVVTQNLSTMTGKLNGAGASIIVFPSGPQSAGSGANMVQDSTDGITATKRVGTRAYQTGDENDSTLTTDGTNTNYPLTDAETYVLDQPLQMGVMVDVDGTEMAVFPEHQGGLPSAPMCSVSTYSISVKNLVGALAALATQTRSGERGSGEDTEQTGEEPLNR